MSGLGKRFFVAVVVAALVVATAPITVSASVMTFTGILPANPATGYPGGAAYKIEVPSNWNGTLLLYSHGYVTPGSANPARDVGDPATGTFLLNHGYALAGSSYRTTGWALEQAIPDQIATLNFFNTLGFATPSRTIAWGHSLGGIITGGLLQTNAERFDAALPMCGVLAGGVAVWNEGLDAQFVIKTLLAPDSSLKLVHITSPGANLGLATGIIDGAQANPAGRARLALAAAVGDLPGWFDPASPEPSADDFAAQEANQFTWMRFVDGPFLFALRAELEARAHGNPSWNTGVNYAQQLERSIDNAEVHALYDQAGLSLDADLATLAAAGRISADPGAVAYLTQNIVFNGKFSGKPVLTIHTTGDGLVLNSDEQAYRSVAQDAKDGQLLREAFVHRAGHCTFTPAETIAALRALETRLNTGKWTSLTDPATLNAAAAALGALNFAPPSFLEFEPAPFLRPYDLGTH